MTALKSTAKRIEQWVWSFGVKTIGRYSEGIRISEECGFTSGQMLEYVYRNQPSGRFGIGRYIDRLFIRHPGWEALRERRRNVELLLEAAIQSALSQKGQVQILDIACGQAAYVLSVLKHLGHADVRALCCDIDPNCLSDAARAAETLGLSSQVTFQRADVFDRKSFVSAEPRPDVILAVGFYDWVIDDDRMRLTMADFSTVLSPTGSLILTFQSDHPNLELVQNVFTGFDGKPVRMKMRSLRDVSGWLTETGFRVDEVLSDDKGYFQTLRASRV